MVKQSRAEQSGELKKKRERKEEEKAKSKEEELEARSLVQISLFKQLEIFKRPNFCVPAKCARVE